MRWTQKTPKEDPRKSWHLYFAWHPITFQYGTWPDRAWGEFVLRRMTGTMDGFAMFEYAPLEHRKLYPNQYGPGKKG